MPTEQIILIALAGLCAGTMNTVVGSGTLVTFPVLVALGYPPVTATTSNALGLISGSVAGAYGYRAELVGQGKRVARYAIASALGAVCGAALLLLLPQEVFRGVVPVLIGLAVLLVAVQPLISRHRATHPAVDRSASPLLFFLIFLVGIYGGYFTASQGIMLLAILGLFLTDPLQRLNGIKNVLAAAVNLVAGAIYAFAAPVNWPVVAVLAVSSTVGGLLGARLGRKLPPTVLRAAMVVIGIVAICYLLVNA